MSTQDWLRIAGPARIAVTLGAAYLVCIGVDWGRLANLQWRADLSNLAYAGVVLAVRFALMVWRWQLIIEILGGTAVGAPQLAVALARSLLIGQPLPSTVGGDMARVFILSARTGAGVATRSVICDRVVGLGGLTVIIIAILPLFGLLVDSSAAFLAMAGVSLGGIAALYLVLAHADWLVKLGLIGKYPALVLDDCRRMFSHDRASWVVLLLALASHLLCIVIIYEFAHALGSSISLLQCLMIVPPALLLSAVPISLGGWGVREGALAAGFALVGASGEAGVATSVLFGLTGPLIGIIAEMMSPLMRGRDAAP